MKNFNWPEFAKRAYYVLWGLFVLSMTLMIFNLVILEQNSRAILPGIFIILGSLIGPWVLLKILQWMFGGLTMKKDS